MKIFPKTHIFFLEIAPEIIFCNIAAARFWCKTWHDMMIVKEM